MRDWVTNVADTYYLLGSVLGPHPYPLMVREFQSVIGTEARAQMLELAGTLPDAIVACVGGGSNAMGIFDAFIDDARRAADRRRSRRRADRRAAATPRGLPAAAPGVLQGTRTFVLQDDDGNIELTHSISAGPRLRGGRPGARVAARARPRRVRARRATRRRSTRSRRWPGSKASCRRSNRRTRSRMRGSSRSELGPSTVMLVNLSGRGDKDVQTVEKMLDGIAA